MICAGVDYGVARIAFAVPSRHVFHEITLKPGDNYGNLEVLSEIVWNEVLTTHADVVAVEAPIQGMSRNVRVGISLAMVAGAIVVAARQAGAHVDVVPPASWKKTVIGIGNANKESVSNYLEEHHPQLHSQCGSQDMVDAVCIAMYAEATLAG